MYSFLYNIKYESKKKKQWKESKGKNSKKKINFIGRYIIKNNLYNKKVTIKYIRYYSSYFIRINVLYYLYMYLTYSQLLVN